MVRSIAITTTFLVLSLLLSASTFAGKREAFYAARWCAAHEGRTEYVLPDGTRVDCLTSTYAVEVDWAPKWAEAIGQALYYATWFPERLPAVLLLVRSEKDLHYVGRVVKVVKTYDLPVQVFVYRIK